jgi:hypothetical protein
VLVFDFINDECPLFAEALKYLIEKNQVREKDITIVIMGKRWYQFYYDFNQGSFTEFCESVEQKDINIENELYRISKEYDTANLFAVDRLLIKKPIEYQKKILVCTFLFYEKLFSTKKVTHYFTTGIAYMYNLASYQVAKKFEVKHISFYDIRNPYQKRTAVSYGIRNRFDKVLEDYKTFKKKSVTPYMMEQLYNFRNKPVQPTYMKNLINKQTINTILIKEFFIRFKKYYFDKNSKYDYFTRNPFGLSFEKLRKLFYSKLLILFSHKIFSKSNLKEDKYFLFPIHMYPEASTLVLSKYYVNQLETIINISKTLPLNTILYVKEHKSALGERGFQFYKELKKYPNIKVISFKENTFELINNSLGIITLSSTVGWEGLLLKKPVIIFGDVFYNDTGLTIKINSFRKLKKVVDEIFFKNFSKVTNDYDAKLSYFVHCLNKNSFPFEFNVYKLDITKKLLLDDNVKNCADCISSLI